MLLLLALCVLGVRALESADYPKVCMHLDGAAFVGGNIYRRPFASVSTPMECCEACLNHNGKDRCVGYTFYYGNSRGDGRAECWLKRNTAVTTRMPFAVSGFPNFYYNETYPDLSHPESEAKHLNCLVHNFLVGAISMVKDFGKNPLRVTLDFVGQKWRWAASMGGMPITIGRSTSMEGCTPKGFRLNFCAVGGNVYAHPIFNLKCPEDCLRYCREFQEQSGRYSCRAVNFITNLDVTECYLKAAPVATVPRMGCRTAVSGLDGFKVGPPPTKAKELIDIYHQLLNDAKCPRELKSDNTSMVM